MCMCMYVYVCICICICIYRNIYVCVYIYDGMSYLYSHMHAGFFAVALRHVCKHVFCVCGHLYVRVCVCMYVYVSWNVVPCLRMHMMVFRRGDLLFVPVLT